jgi:hypothetical protein
VTATPGTIDIVWSAYRSVLSDKRVAYLSAPITSGRRALDAAATGQARSEVIHENIAAGTNLAREIAKLRAGAIVAPTVFSGHHQGWSQTDYMQMWLGMIEQNVGDVYMSPDWAFSNGCAEEYLKTINLAHGFGTRWDITPRRPDGRVVHLHEGMEALSEALQLMQERKLKSDTLASALIGLYAAHVAWAAPELSCDLPTDYNREVVHGVDRQRVLTVMREITPLLRCGYGWEGHVQLSLAGGAVRTINAWPEGVVLDIVEGRQSEA